jgi:hypothetical protein
MTTQSPIQPDVQPAPRPVLWGAPRVTSVAVTRPNPQTDVLFDPGASGAVEWLPRASADRRL